MTCNWDNTWSPGPDILDCDWVACLDPPQPPEYTNLRVTDWFGEPIQFGEKVRFVCERGKMFEDDPAKEYVEYQCQNGSLPGTERGYFKIPKEDEWPRCLTGIVKSSHDHHKNLSLQPRSVLLHQMFLLRDF